MKLDLTGFEAKAKKAVDKAVQDALQDMMNRANEQLVLPPPTAQQIEFGAPRRPEFLSQAIARWPEVVRRAINRAKT